MGRRPTYAPLRVYMNNRRVGTLSRAASGAIGFTYHEGWLNWEHALPVSLSLPLREMPYRGEPVFCRFRKPPAGLRPATPPSRRDVRRTRDRCLQHADQDRA